MSRAFSENRMARTIHDPSKYWNTKMTKSSNYFKQTRVQTCSHVLYKNGKAIAVAFPLDKAAKKASKLPETKSITQATYARKGNLHAGMPVKPLMPYHPNAHRSRLPTATVVMPYRNASSIVIGDRSSDYRRQFTSHNRITYPKHRLEDATTNGGILATKTKWTHRRMGD
ncbi:unnamed protein product [Moneuplotes crassus]|uniref:Uncharacterized protein n=1 Tax=Euplotes crassus TaxID=5936 RepID=A0AAD1XJM6_EUPCR|nr:unnamed protein product [Moneuplotes crassus]